MNKTELVSIVGEKCGLDVKKSNQVVELVFSSIKDGIQKEGEFVCRGLGSFHLKERKARKARNPKTGEAVMVSPSRSVSFKVAGSFKKELNEPIIEEKIKEENVDVTE